MKKVLLLIILLISGINSLAAGISRNTRTISNNPRLNCAYISNPDVLLERVVSKIKREKRENDLFCDRDGTKMAYYLVEGEDYNLTLGIAIPITMTTTNSQFKTSFLSKLDDYKTFFKTLDKKNLGKTPLPDKEVIRFYGQVSGTDKFFIIGKYVNDLNTKNQKMVISNHGKEFFERIKLFEGIPVEYSDEVVF